MSLALHATAETPGPLRPASAASALVPSDPGDDGTSDEGQEEEDDCGWVDVGCHTKEAITGWFRSLAKSALKPVLGFLASTQLATPEIGSSSMSQAEQIWATSRTIANTCFVLLVLIAGVLLMAGQTFSGVAAPGQTIVRLVAAFTAMNTSLILIGYGRLTDAQGRTVDFRNTVIIMTSNIGSEHLLQGVTSEGDIEPDARARVMGELRRHFRPEFLNRVDDIVLFKPLTLPQIEQVVDLMFNDLRARLADRQMRLSIDEDARRLIAEQGFDPVYGARPLRRFIAREVETRIGRALIAGDVRNGATVTVTVAGEELNVRYENPE
ncbi:AAA family ATPase [Actinomadura sp.]|uniref:AAA family ATPase n=2 Tax=Actinomadura sp. TaxID=1989 RepID=UPI0037C90392